MPAKPGQSQHPRSRWIVSTVFIICLNLALLALPAGQLRAQAEVPVNPQCIPRRIFLPAIFQAAGQITAPAAQSGAEEAFAAQVMDGEPGVVRGVYVGGVLALKVTQQPEDNAGYVSAEPGTATQFSQAGMYDVIGLLAHNTLSGQFFFKLGQGGVVAIIYGDGTRKYYQVTAIAQYQALQPDSVTSDFVNLQTGETLSASQLFDRVYAGGDHVTFQTCISRDGSSSWGRLFIIAEPISV